MSKDNIACVKDVVREDVREGGREEVGYKLQVRLKVQRGGADVTDQGRV